MTLSPIVTDCNTAIIKCIINNTRYTIRYCHGLQCTAISKCTTTNTRDAITYSHGLQCTTFKCPTTDTRDTIRYSQGLQCLQPSNASLPILVTLSGIFTDNALQPENATIMTLLPIVTDCNHYNLKMLHCHTLDAITYSHGQQFSANLNVQLPRLVTLWV